MSDFTIHKDEQQNKDILKDTKIVKTDQNLELTLLVGGF
jgi:hypothetical protein